MATVGDPNLLAVAGLIITACGLGLLGRAVLSAVSASSASAPHAASKARVDLAFAAPMLLAGIFAIASPQFVSSSLNPLITSILLAAAFALLLYALLEGFIVEGPMANPADTKLKLIAPPATSAPSLPETSARTVEPSLADATPAHVALKG